MAQTILPIIIAYLLGAIPFALIVTRLKGIKDIRTVGSGNLGATNVWRVAGRGAALWVFVGDIGKGVLAVGLGRYVVVHYGVVFVPDDAFLVICALAAVLGHVFPVYLRFKGGKGVNTALGAIITLLPVQSLMAMVVFIFVVAVSRYVSLGSMAAVVALCFVVFVQKYVLSETIAPTYLCLTLVLAVLIFLTHRQNIVRLWRGTESRFSLSSRCGRDGSNV